MVVGRDGPTRGAVLRVASTGARESLLQRPLQRLYPLEINSLDADEEDADEEEGTEEPNGMPATDGEECSNRVTTRSEGLETRDSSRPKRAAAQRARDRNMAITLCEDEDFSD